MRHAAANNVVRKAGKVLLSNIRTLLRSFGKARITSAFESSLGFSIIHFLHLVLMRVSPLLVSARPTRDIDRTGHLVICPPGGGNIGDQALVEAAAWNLNGPVVLIMRVETNYELPPWLVTRGVTKIALPHLLYGMNFSHFRNVMQFLDLARRSESVTVIGADIMDGRYSAAASINRWSIAILAQLSGATSAVVGFSWNSSPSASSEAGLLKASHPVVLWVRDPASYRRVSSLGATNARLCADIVFSHPARQLSAEYTELPNPLSRRIGSLRSYAIINASGYIGTDSHVLSEYESIIKSFHQAGLGIVFLPHVMRGRSDFACLTDLYANNSDNAVLVDLLLTPAQVSELAAHAQIVVTGRMHLAVLSSMSGTPALTLATQGKVGGLYELLDHPEWVLDSETDFSLQVRDALTNIGSSEFAFPDSGVLENIQQLSSLPFRDND